MAFSKDFLVTVAKSEDQRVINLAKERLDKVKVDQPAVAAFYILDEIVVGDILLISSILKTLLRVWKRRWWRKLISRL